MANVSVDDVRDVINVGSAVISDSKITKMIKRAEVTLELEIRLHNQFLSTFSWSIPYRKTLYKMAC